MIAVKHEEDKDMATDSQTEAHRISVDRRLYTTADRSQLVEEGDPRAAFLWAAGRGYTVDAAEADRLGYEPLAAKPKPDDASGAGRVTPADQDDPKLHDRDAAGGPR